MLWFVFGVLLCLLGVVGSIVYLYDGNDKGRSKQQRGISAVIGVAFLWGVFVSSAYFGESMFIDGTALTSLQKDAVYVTESAEQRSTKEGIVFTAKLVRYRDNNRVRFYEIKASELHNWDGKSNPFPPKFKVLLDGKTYVLIPKE